MKPAAPNYCARRMTRGWSLDEMMTTGTSGYSPRTCSRAESRGRRACLQVQQHQPISGCSCSAWPRVAALAASRVRELGQAPCSTCRRRRGTGVVVCDEERGLGLGPVCHGRAAGWGEGSSPPLPEGGCAYCCLRYSIHSRTRRGMCLRWGNTT